jgi:hypothetical protein
MDYSEAELDKMRRIAKKALAAERRTWADWLSIARYLETGRQWAMEMSHSAQPMGVRYNDALAVWFKRNPDFERITKQVRNDLMRCLENEAEIEVFRSVLPDADRARLNNPTSMLKVWKARRQVRRTAGRKPRASAEASL